MGWTMKFLFASDSFKGTLSSSETGRLLTEAAKKVFPDCECGYVEVADGGEGTTEAVLCAVDGRAVEINVCGPLWEPVTAVYGILDGKRAVLEMAQASGLTLLGEASKDPRRTTTYGTGEMILDAVNRGYRDISIAIGGSATNDGGMGCMRALGVRFFDEDDRELQGRGEDLIRVRRMDLSGLDPRLAETRFTIMCDVRNPLCGAEGATYTFGKQKGGTPKILDELEAGMQNYRDQLQIQFGIDMDTVPGAGAAGGLGAALMVFLKGQLKSGVETVLDLIGFDEKLQGVDLVVTGEGETDWQSAFGKVVQGVGSRCRKYRVPVVVLSGGMGKGAEQIYDSGIASIMTTVNKAMPLQDALDHAEELYRSAAWRMFRMIRTGMELRGEKEAVITGREAKE